MKLRQLMNGFLHGLGFVTGAITALAIGGYLARHETAKWLEDVSKL